MAMSSSQDLFGSRYPLSLSLTAPCFAQQRPASIFTVANVKAEAEAANAVEAKKLAIQSAETRAFRLLVSRLTGFRTEPRIPGFSAEQIERPRLRHRCARRRGFGNLLRRNVRRNIFRARRFGASRPRRRGPIVDRGPEILIVPVYVEDGAARTTDRNPWRSALMGLDLTHALLPAKVAPARGDITAAIANDYFANPASGMDTLKSQYKTTQVLFAVAGIDGGGDALTLKLVGSDAARLRSHCKEGESQRRHRRDRRQGGGAPRLRYCPAALEADARLALAARPGGECGRGRGAFISGRRLVRFRSPREFSGLKEWQAIRMRLQSSPAVRTGT